MAQKVKVTVTDDITGEEGAEPVFFALDKHMFEIDLTAQNRARLRRALDEFIEHAHSPSLESRRSLNGARTGGPRSAAPRDRQRSNDIRLWARKKGYPVSDRGRIPRQIEQEYDSDRSLSGAL